MMRLCVCLVLLCASWGCRRQLAVHPPPCPGHFPAAPARAHQIWQELRQSQLPKSLIKVTRPGAGRVRYCFGKIGSPVIDHKGVMYLDRTLPNDVLAARVAHLGMHLLSPISFHRGEPCHKQVQKALQQESQAISVELLVRMARKVRSKRLLYPFAAAAGRCTREQRAAFVYKQLLQQPKGMPPLRRDYMRRCISEQAKAK